MNDLGVSIRNLQTKDIPEAMKLVLEEGWNQTPKDWELFLNNPRNSCKCAELGGKLVGTTTSYNFLNKVAWISMVLVNEDFRGRGISKMLLNAVLSELKNCQSIKLDATEAGRRVYQKLGFVDEYRISRMVNSSFNPAVLTELEIPSDIMTKDVANIVEFDKDVFGAYRPQLIQAWINDFPEKCRVLKRNTKIEGFVLGRIGNRFHQIGPVSSTKLIDAKSLISGVLPNLIGKPVVVDVMNDKTDFVHWLTHLGFEKKREFTRMFLKSNLYSGEKQKQYLIGGPEFG